MARRTVEKMEPRKVALTVVKRAQSWAEKTAEKMERQKVDSTVDKKAAY